MSVRPEAAEAPTARRQATRERLLDAAAAVFAEEGLTAAPVETIAARAGFTRGAFYSNFESKEELFLALFKREFERRAHHLKAQAEALEPALREQDLHLTPDEAAVYIADFFAPETNAITWYVLETEFLLLAMRDPSLAPEYHAFTDSFYADIADVVEQVIIAAGRRLVLPVERAMPVLSSVYERTLRTSALTGTAAGNDLSGLGGQLAELLFALTEAEPLIE